MLYLQKIYNLRHDSLFKNSFYLMLAAASMAGFGFFFWLITARLFQTEEIGIATTMISVMSLVATFGLIGFGSTFVRFLPKSENPNDQVNTGVVVVGFTALVLATLFVLFIKKISPPLSFIVENPILALSFVIFSIMTALNILTDAFFMAHRQNKYVFYINTTFSAIKMVLPFAFIGWGSVGIFLSAAIGQTIGFVLSVWVMITKFNYRPKIVINNDVLKKVWRYSATVYFASALNMLPASVLPILITNKLGPKEAAYYYIVMMLGNLLYIIPRSVTGSLFAEGSHDELTVKHNIVKAIKIITALITPAMIFLVFFGSLILKIFGKNYDQGGYEFLVLITLSTIAVSIYSLCNALFSINKDLRSIIINNVIYAIIIITLSNIWVKSYGLNGIGFAWIFGNFAAGIFGLILLNRKNNKYNIC